MTQFILEQGPQETDPSSVYGRTDVFTVPERGYIKMMFLKISYTFGAGANRLPKASLAGFETHEQITLENFGLPICYDDHVYGQCRTYQTLTDKYKQIESGVTFSGGVNINTTKTLIRPLYFCAFDNGNSLLATPELTVRAITRKSHADMGFLLTDDNVKIDSLNVRLKIVYEQVKEYVFRPLKNTYNARALAPIPLDVGSTNYTLKLKCPFDVISIMFMIKSTSVQITPPDEEADPPTVGVYSSAVNTRIDSVNLSFPNGEYGLYENSTDYSLVNTGSMEKDFNIYIISFGSRTSPEFIKMNGSKNPTVAELRFAPVRDTTAKLYCVLEYVSTIENFDEGLYEPIKDTTK